MNASAERRRQDLAWLQGLCAASNGRLVMVSASGRPPDHFSVDLVCRTAGCRSYPSRATERTRIDIRLLDRYPFQAPVVHVHPVTFHPNVYTSGLVCLGFKWSPTETLDLLIRRIAQIVTFEPAVVNTASPANPGAAAWYGEALARFPSAFPTDRIDFLSAAAPPPKPQWRDLTVGPEQRKTRTIQCEKCPQQLRVPDVSGIQVRCPRCLHTFRVAA